MFRIVGTTLAVLMLGTAAAHAGHVDEAGDATEFIDAFCAASHEEQHIFVVPAAVLTGQSAISCDDGESAIRTSEPADDPGHMVFNIDPPEGSQSGLDCDGKADVGMTLVALNCLPVSMETTEHPKN